jgi:peptidoglycan/LPS O-acetylase OafA/YrhL
MNDKQLTPRVHGLDTLRALAIVLVVLHHYVLFVAPRDTFGWLGEIGWVGVDLFFALSGYLIGNQIFAAMRSAQGFSPARFYLRRLLRTLPNYYVVLALYFLWPAFQNGQPLPPLWKFLTFTQNLKLEPGTAFSHAWSLSIEEQFYLLLPAAALLVASLRRSLRWAWTGLALAVAAGMLTRGWLWRELVDANASELHNYYKFIYYSSLCRCDELLAGVALALVKNYHVRQWQRITAYGNLALAGGVALGTLAFSLFLADHFGFAMTVLGYPMLALSFSLLVVAALSGDSLLCSTRVPGAGALARWSYAIYLTHKQVCIMAAPVLQKLGYGPQSPLAIGVMLALGVLSGWLLYRLVETPFMALRRRVAPTSQAAPGALTPLPR